MRTKTKIETTQVVADNLSWFNTVKQSRGFGGPVVHYWNDSLSFIGAGTDWRLEGIMGALLNLEKRTSDSSYLERARACGAFALMNQRNDGTFVDSAFEENPAMGYTSQIHESAVDIALLQLAIRLNEEKKESGHSFLHAAKKNIDQSLIPRFWNENENTFQQYAKGQWDQAPNLFVPNKIATAVESLLLLTEATGDERYAKRAVQAAEKILELQSTEKKHAGGIFQANDRDHLITFYTARCIPPLLALYQYSKDKRFRTSARNAAKFIRTQQQKDGSFAFGFHQGKAKRYPIFGAGTGDILRALDQNGQSETEVKKGTTFLLSLRQPTGAFASFRGLRTHPDGNPIDSWKDHLSVAGWNDKALRFLSQRVKRDIPTPQTSDFAVECTDGRLVENEKEWIVTGETHHRFGKNESFSDGDPLGLKRVSYALGTNSIRPVSRLGRVISRYTGAR